MSQDKSPFDTFYFRELDNSDLNAVADVQLQSWRGTYVDVLPSAYLGEPMARDISRRWSKGLTPEDLLWGAYDKQGDLLGFAAVHLGDAPYLDNFHVLEHARGSGVSQLLMGRVAQALCGQGARTLWLTVVATNLRARAFYRRLGGQEGVAGPDEMFGKVVTSLPVYWSDLAELSKNVRQVV